MAKSDLDLSSVHSRILNANAAYYGVDLSQILEDTGKQIAAKLIQIYGIAKSYAVVCGLAGNGADGLAVARHLKQSGCEVTVYLIGRQTSLETQTAKDQWVRVRDGVKIKAKQDVFAKDIENHDVIIEALIGTGLKGQVTKRFRDVVKRISHFKKPIIAIDRPISGYTPLQVISINSPKTEEAEVIHAPVPADLEMRVGPGEVAELYKPRTRTHKDQNGTLLVWYGGDDATALNSLIKSAESYSTKVSIYAPKIETAKSKFVPESDLEAEICSADAMLCLDIDNTITNKALISFILNIYSDRNFVFDDSLLCLVDLNEFLFSHNLLIIAQKQQTSDLSRRVSAEKDIYINLQGFQDLLWGDNPYSGQNEMRMHVNASKNKYELLGLSAAYATKNPLWLAMCAAEFNSGIDL